MNAVDTNVLARFFINDEDDREAARQRPAAIAALSGAVFVPVSVVLEFEWVMRGFYELSRKDIQRVFESLCGLENVQIEDRSIVLAALDAYQQGLDFADALHLARADFCSTFLSFDQRLKKRAAAAGLSPAVEAPKA
ncbi:MAG: type II toxin-antitoxin system VapC family toxin [Gallionellaceae bacterium]|nr:type II toxin-antitoxin system VapC family toxin [Gallionellaceae bacterium]